MAEPSTLIPNLNEIMEEHAQPEGEVHLEPTEEVHLELTEENRPSEQPEVQQLQGSRKEKDSEQEAKTKEQIRGFKFLYMSLLQDFEEKMKDRDQKLDDNDAYRRKIWLENLDFINNNLSKFLEVMTEMERTMNTLGQRQDDLNKKVDVTNELVLEEQIERENDKKKKRTEMKFPKFNPNLATLDLDPPNIFAPS